MTVEEIEAMLKVETLIPNDTAESLKKKKGACSLTGTTKRWHHMDQEGQKDIRSSE